MQEQHLTGKTSWFLWDWEITKETKVILGYQCKKAISKAFKGDFTAWFTEEIPINAGPEKFHGLPGLILHVGNANQAFIAENIAVKNVNLVIKRPQTAVKTVTLLEMFAIAEERFTGDKNLKPTKEGSQRIKKVSY